MYRICHTPHQSLAEKSRLRWVWAYVAIYVGCLNCLFSSVEPSPWFRLCSLKIITAQGKPGDRRLSHFLNWDLCQVGQSVSGEWIFLFVSSRFVTLKIQILCGLIGTMHNVSVHIQRPYFTIPLHVNNNSKRAICSDMAVYGRRNNWKILIKRGKSEGWFQSWMFWLVGISCGPLSLALCHFMSSKKHSGWRKWFNSKARRVVHKLEGPKSFSQWNELGSLKESISASSLFPDEYKWKDKEFGKLEETSLNSARSALILNRA